MKAEKLKSGKYRARAYDYTDSEGKKHYKSFTSDSKKEAERMATEFEYKKQHLKQTRHITLEEAIDLYIDERRHTHSEATIYGYEKIKRTAFADLLPIFLDKITTEMLIQAVKAESNRGLAPKTVVNHFGLIRPVLKKYAPSLDVNVTLPRVPKRIFVPPEPENVINAVKGTNVELPVLLAMWLSFCLSEIKGLKRSSIVSNSEGDFIQINQVMVYAGKNVEKELAKVDSRTRKHRLPPYIKELIDKLPEEQEYIVPECGTTINNRLKKALNEAGVKEITIHKCRHLFASITLAKLGINSEIIKDEGGWSTNHTMEKVYTHTFSSDRIEADKIIDDYFMDILKAKPKKLSYEEFINKLGMTPTEDTKIMYESYLKNVG